MDRNLPSLYIIFPFLLYLFFTPQIILSFFFFRNKITDKRDNQVVIFQTTFLVFFFRNSFSFLSFEWNWYSFCLSDVNPTFSHKLPAYANPILPWVEPWLVLYWLSMKWSDTTMFAHISALLLTLSC